MPTRSVLSVLTPAPSPVLVRPEKATRFLAEIPEADRGDAVALASVLACAYLGLPHGTVDDRPLCRQIYAERISLDGTPREVVLSRRPIAEVLSVTADGAEIDPAEVHGRAAAGVLWRTDGTCWSGEIVVTYEAGYLAGQPGTEGGEPVWGVPLDLEQAVLFIAASAHRAASEASVGETGPITRESVPGVGTIEYGEPSAEASRADGVPAASAAILDRYRTPGGLA